MNNYSRYWAEDVLIELGYDYRDRRAIDWLLRWMNRNFLDPRGESVVSMSDICKEEFREYIQKRDSKSMGLIK